MKSIGVPIIPGTEIIGSAEEARKCAEKIGFPLLVKASAGGGGKGIRLVNSAAELESSFTAASEEAKKAFGNGEVFLEKYLTSVRHIEIQILADEFGNVVTLGERDCSLQLNKQKVIEEAPSPVVSEILRKSLEKTAKKVAIGANYTNSGTVEFLLDKENNYYFIEMNTRLQVEHPITCEISGIDIVKWQIRIACKMPLGFKQKDIELKGNAIECRINARSKGTVEFLHIPGGPHVYFDTALVQETEISPFYDSMIGKLIVYSSNREDAIRKMEAALCEIVIKGIETNIDNQLIIIRNLKFKNGDYDTCFLQTLHNEA